MNFKRFVVIISIFLCAAQAFTQGFDNLLEETRDWWLDWFEKGSVIKTPDPRLNLLANHQCPLF